MDQISRCKRGQRLSDQTFAAGQADHFAALSDLYDPASNKDGYINMGASLTTLMTDDLINLLEEVQGKFHLRQSDLHYYVNHGSDEFRGAIATHWSRVGFHGKQVQSIGADNVVLSTGATVALDMLAHVLCDPGDVLLVPVPCYAMFGFDVGQRAGVEIVGVDAGSDLQVGAFEAALTTQEKRGKVVRGVLFSSPNNPVGTVYTAEQLRRLVQFCAEHELELIADEMYGETVFDPQAQFVAALDATPANYVQHVHTVAGFAKGLALPGFKVGFVMSLDPHVVAGLRNLAYFDPVSNYTQFALTRVLQDPNLGSFMEVYRERLRVSYAQIREVLSKLTVRVLPAEGGMFVMADFAKYMPARTFEAEAAFAQQLHTQLKINIAPGQAYQMPEPGWIRICYPQEHATLVELGRRLATLSVT